MAACSFSLRADDHARRKGRGIGAMLGVKHGIAIDQLGGIGARFLALEHPQQIGGVTQLLARSHRLQPLAQSRVRRDDHRHLRGQTNALADDGIARMSAVSGWKTASAETAVRNTSIGCADLMVRIVQDRRRQFARSLQLLVELRRAALDWQLAAQQQPRRLFERRMLGKVINGITAVAQFANPSINEQPARRTVGNRHPSIRGKSDWLVCFVIYDLVHVALPMIA